MKTAIIGCVLLFVASSCGKSTEKMCQAIAQKTVLCFKIPGPPSNTEVAFQAEVRECIGAYFYDPAGVREVFKTYSTMTCKEVREAAAQ